MCYCCVSLSVAARMSLNDEGYVVRIRGLPWSCTQEEVASFFSGEKTHVFTAEGMCSVSTYKTEMTSRLMILFSWLFISLSEYKSFNASEHCKWTENCLHLYITFRNVNSASESEVKFDLGLCPRVFSFSYNLSCQPFLNCYLILMFYISYDSSYWRAVL